MGLNAFPPVEKADKTGLLAIGGELDIETLLTAYSSGIFPWPFDERFMAWFAPPKRAVLFLDDYHVSKRLLSIIKKNEYKIKVNKNFEKVIRYCATSQNRKGQKGTWIIDPMIEAYCDLQRAGFAHSVECYMDGELCGGVYGVAIGKMFAGESMFYVKPNASQIAFYHLVKHLKSEGVKMLDCQVMTPHSKKFGAVEIKREEFMRLLKKAVREKDIDFTKF
jgi:leucyl/phenylalanyl-tRNA--protein transferase